MTEGIFLLVFSCRPPLALILFRLDLASLSKSSSELLLTHIHRQDRPYPPSHRRRRLRTLAAPVLSPQPDHLPFRSSKGSNLAARDWGSLRKGGPRLKARLPFVWLRCSRELVPILTGLILPLLLPFGRRILFPTLFLQPSEERSKKSPQGRPAKKDSLRPCASLRLLRRTLAELKHTSHRNHA